MYLRGLAADAAALSKAGEQKRSQIGPESVQVPKSGVSWGQVAVSRAIMQQMQKASKTIGLYFVFEDPRGSQIAQKWFPNRAEVQIAIEQETKIK